MFFDKFTKRARDIIILAQSEAKNMKNAYIGTEHLLLAIIKDGSGTAAKALKSLDVTSEKVRNSIIKIIGQGEVTHDGSDSLSFTPRAKKVFEYALREAANAGLSSVGSTYLLLGIIHEGEGLASQVLTDLGVSVVTLREELEDRLDRSSFGDSYSEADENSDLPFSRGKARGEGDDPGMQDEFGMPQGTRRPRRARKSYLEKFATNMTEMARRGKLDPLIGRELQVERVIQILSRRNKNNPVLVGEAGVGKTAIVEGLASAIANGKVPENLKKQDVFSLDLGALVGGTRFRGDFEQRLEMIIQEIRERQNIILFIDEIHNLVGTGSAEGTMDAAQLLKPMLARGEIKVIGATTLDEYQKYVEKDTALERRFQPVNVPEPTIDEGVAILKGISPYYEKFHGVKISDKAIVSAVKLSDRYISDRQLPDKAIDLIDEAGARARLSTLYTPEEIGELQERLEVIRTDKEKAIEEQNFEIAAKLRKEEDDLTDKLTSMKKQWEKEQKSQQKIIDDESIAEVLSMTTGIPLVQVSTEESERLLRMEEELHRRIIGQDEAIKAVSQAIRRTRSGVKDPKRPSGSFIFAGSTGVGKTELAKTLAEFLFGNEDALIQVDMSEYSEKYNVSRMFGSSPGYIGYEEGGQLTEKVRRRPFSVILFDEIEKAHPDVFNVLLQVLEDGHLTDGKGRKVDFKNTVIIMTTNLGTENFAKGISLGFNSSSDVETQYDQMKNKVHDALKKSFRPEFLNRVDETIVFTQLNRAEVLQIEDLLVDRLNERLALQNIQIEMTQQAKEALINDGYNLALGARPMRRALQKNVEDILSEKMLFGEIKPNSKVLIDLSSQQKSTTDPNTKGDDNKEVSATMVDKPIFSFTPKVAPSKKIEETLSEELATASDE